jgi:hypothetical protein
MDLFLKENWNWSYFFYSFLDYNSKRTFLFLWFCSSSYEYTHKLSLNQEILDQRKRQVDSASVLYSRMLTQYRIICTVKRVVITISIALVSWYYDAKKIVYLLIILLFLSHFFVTVIILTHTQIHANCLDSVETRPRTWQGSASMDWISNRWEISELFLWRCS